MCLTNPRCLHEYCDGFHGRYLDGVWCGSQPSSLSQHPSNSKIDLLMPSTLATRHVHHLAPSRYNHFVGNSCSCGVISCLDRTFWLWLAHFNECLVVVGYHFSCCDKEGGKLRFGSGCHDKFDNLVGDGEHRTIELWEWFIFRQIDEGKHTAVGLRFIEESRVCMCTQDYIACSLDDAII